MSKGNIEGNAQQVGVLQRTASLVLAAAVHQFFAGLVKFGQGAERDHSFSYDLETPRKITADDLQAIENIALELIRQKRPITREQVPLVQAQQLFADQPYQMELLASLEQAEEVALVRLGDVVCVEAGPILESTAKIKPSAFKLLALSGAYWQGDASNNMLQRVSGVVFATHSELVEHLKQVEEAHKRDHRYLGKQLDLFSHSEDIGAGLVLWHPKGAMIRYLAERFSQEAQLKNGYEWIYSPHIGRENLWLTSGHLDFYKDSMYAPIEVDQERYYLKPMNCPFHIEVFKSKPRSYRELPTRYAEFGTVYRYEMSGALQGLTRVRGFTQDDAHIMCTEEQAFVEIQRTLRFSLYVLRTFGLNTFTAYISTKPEGKAIGSDDKWEQATEALRQAVEREGLPYQYDVGGGAFYGPKIDLKVTDSLGREWQLSTIQFDFNLPERFDITYIGKDNAAHRPFVVHRALFGSLERFLGLLIEHYGGAFPLWIAPVQATLVPVADRHADYAHEVARKLKERGLRVEVDDSSDRLGAKIRNSQLNKVPFALVVGDKEVSQGEISVRTREGEELGAMTIAAFLESIQGELEKGMPRILE